MSSCVSFLPPSALHHDMLPNAHPIIEDTLTDQVHEAYASAHYLNSIFHNRRSPEIERNIAYAGTVGYGFADQQQSAGLSLGYSAGRVREKEGEKFKHSNFFARGSYAYDFHAGRWHGQVLKLQLGASRGFGDYQDYVAEEYQSRDEYNLAISDRRWFYSMSYGSAWQYAFVKPHALGMGFYFNSSTDFDPGGFRAQFFTLDLDYIYQDRYRFEIGGMMDARLTPRGETLYMGLGYQYRF